MQQRGWYCPICEQVVRPKENVQAAGCGQLMVVGLWLSTLVLTVWLSAWWLGNLLGVTGLLNAAVATVVAGIVLYMVQAKTLPTVRSCPICQGVNLHRLPLEAAGDEAHREE